MIVKVHQVLDQNIRTADAIGRLLFNMGFYAYPRKNPKSGVEILEERVVSSRTRLNPRGVKRKMSNYPLRPR